MTTAYLVKIDGRVTGVGFRYSAMYRAESLPDLKGYIRNVGYRQVEALVQGPEEQVDMMLEWLKHGPSLAHVERFRANPVPETPDLPEFTIR